MPGESNLELSSFHFNKNRLAKPKKIKNPIASVIDVSMTLVPTAGSLPNLWRSKGMANPANTATKRLINIAIAITPARVQFVRLIGNADMQRIEV